MMDDNNTTKKNSSSSSTSAFDFIKSTFLSQQWEGAGFLLFACAQDRSVSSDCYYEVSGNTSRFSSCPKGPSDSEGDGVVIVWDKLVCSQRQQQASSSRRQRYDRMYLRKQSILQRHDDSEDVFRDELPSSQSSIDTCTTATMQTNSFDDDEELDVDCNVVTNGDDGNDDHPYRDDDDLGHTAASSIFRRRTTKTKCQLPSLTLGTSLGFYKSPALAFDDDDEEDDDNSIIFDESD